VPDLTLLSLAIRLSLALPQNVKDLLEVLGGISRVFSVGATTDPIPGNRK
jgi:hypothetical protein